MMDFDEDGDANDPDESDQDFSDDPEFVRCPNCRKLVSEDAEQCPHCGTYVSREDAPSKPRWFFIAVVVTLIVITVVWVIKGW